MDLLLNWNDEQDAISADRWIGTLEQLLSIAANEEGVESGEVSLTFVNDEAIRELNREYRSVDASTDVLSFPLFDEELLGDIVISVPTAISQSEQYGHSLEREIGFLFVHGFLHLLGYDHDDDASEKAMFEKQERILQAAGLRR